MVHAILDCIDNCSILCVPALSQHLEAGEHFGTTDEYCRLHRAITGIRSWHYVYAAQNAESILFHGLHYQLLHDNRSAFFLPDVSDIFWKPGRYGRRRAEPYYGDRRRRCRTDFDQRIG